MGCIKSFKINTNIKEWHILKEKSLKLEEIKEELTTRHLKRQCTPVLIALMLCNTIGFVKNVVHTEVKRLLKKKLLYKSLIDFVILHALNMAQYS